MYSKLACENKTSKLPINLNSIDQSMQLEKQRGGWIRSPNHRRSGSMRVLGSSEDCKLFFIIFPRLSLLGRSTYIWSLRPVAADRCPPPPPAPFLSFGRL